MICKVLSRVSFLSTAYFVQVRGKGLTIEDIAVLSHLKDLFLWIEDFKENWFIMRDRNWQPFLSKSL